MSQEEHRDRADTRYVYLVPQEAVGQDASASGGEIDLKALWQTIWAGRVSVLVVTLIFMAGGVAYAFLAPEWFEAQVVLSPVGKKSISSSLASLGGLASLAGIDIPTAGNNEPLAVLKSKSLAREFIEDQHLLPVLYASKWDETTHAWKTPITRQPDIRDGVKYFDEKIRSVTDDKKTGLVTMTIKWKDPKLAADWANTLVKRVNDRMRVEAIAEAQSSIAYLQSELAATNIVSLQQSIGRVLEGEMQKMALARANEQFAFKVVDNAYPPRSHLLIKWIGSIFVSVLIGLTSGIIFLCTRPGRVVR